MEAIDTAQSDKLTFDPVTGTTTPIYVPRRGDSAPLQVGKGYFWIQIRGAQVYYRGSVIEQLRSLMVASQVRINHPALGDGGLRAIQKVKEIRRDQAEQLGLAPNLIDLVPAVMTHITVSIDFIVDTKNRLRQFSAVIGNDLSAVISLVPEAAAVAKVINTLAQKLIQSLLPDEQRKPVLQFTGDFNLPAGRMRPGYHVILGTRDAHAALPTPLPKIEVRDGFLFLGGRQVTDLSYVILEIHTTDVRTRELNAGARWDAKLREAEDAARWAAREPGEPGKASRKHAWGQCKGLLREARGLLFADPNYLTGEAEDIYLASYNLCKSELFFTNGQRGPVPPQPYEAAWQPDEQEDRLMLGIGLDVDIPARLREYDQRVAAAKQRYAEHNR